MSQPEQNINKLVDHLFRHEAGKMVSILTKIFGTEHLELAEDVVQDTLIQALQSWMHNGIPDNPSAWLFRVAKNKAINVINRNKHAIQFDFSDNEKILLTSNYSFTATMDDLWREELVKDDMLRMMFACCHPGISEESQVTLILKLLCGFSTAEIAKSFLTSEDTISKRLYRTKEFFRQHKVKLVIPSIDQLKSRTDAVLNAIYLLFNEGYNATHAEELIRKDMIEEAIRLCLLLLENTHTQLPDVYALLALMNFHNSRSDSRLTAEGAIILLPEQDRSKWNYQMILLGNDYMELAARGDGISKYHIEAAIAFEYCIASSFETTNWNNILAYYDLLSKFIPSPITELNKAVVIMQLHGVHAALEFIENITDKKRLENFYLYHAILGDIFVKMHRVDDARSHFKTAMLQTQSTVEKKMLQEKIAALAQ